MSQEGGNLPDRRPPDPELMREFLATQNRELDVKLREMEVTSEEIKSNRELAEMSIGAQERDRQRHTEVYSKTHLRETVLAGVAVVGIFVFLGAAMYSGNTDFAERIMDLVLGAAVGFAGGGFVFLRRRDEE